ncbi:MAG TPA: metallophosphoesterase family protein [Dehalococcoidia bacterium]|nr:metallophosphoesterase family protein [Dehalococcoidia bacterium]
MIVGLVSDTHIEDDLVGMPPEIVQTFRRFGVEIILHLGDIHSSRVLDVLEEAAPVIAVRDYVELPSEDPRMSETRRVVELAGKRIGMVHDIGWPGPRIHAHRELRFPPEPLPYVLERKFGQVVDIVAFGHTHEELMHWHEGVFFINPGSALRPGMRHPRGSLGTVAIMEIHPGGVVSAEIVKLARGEGVGT